MHGAVQSAVCAMALASVRVMRFMLGQNGLNYVSYHQTAVFCRDEISVDSLSFRMSHKAVYKNNL